jgi:hypothetical protein
VKFLCVPCDQPMKLTTVQPPDRGSLSVRFSCPECGYEMAMLTNPYETQVVQSLGVRVGPDGAVDETAAVSVGAAPGGGAAVPAGASGSAGMAGAAEPGTTGGRCPFADMIPGYDAAVAGADTTRVDTIVAGGNDTGVPESPARPASVPVWTDQATARMKSIPAFVRPMARNGIEKFARERGYATIDEKVLEEARAFFGM